MINPRAIATLGIGYGPLAVATLGFLPLLSAEIPYQPSSGPAYRIEQQHAALVRLAAVEAADVASFVVEVDWSDDDEEVINLLAVMLGGT